MRRMPQGKKIGFLLSNPMLLQGLSGFLPLLVNQGMMNPGNQMGPWGGLNLMGQTPGSNPTSSTPPSPPQIDISALQNAGKMIQAFNDAGLTEQLFPMFKQFQPLLNGLLKASTPNTKVSAVKSIGQKMEPVTLARYTGIREKSKLSRRRKRYIV